MSLLDTFASAPPISRTLALVAFSFSLLLYTGVLDYGLFHLSLPAVIRLPPELWRLLTSLIITGPNFGMLFDTYFIYVYGAKLEIASPRFTQRADFVTYLCFCSGIILTLNLFVTSGGALASAFALAFITTSTRDSWGLPVTFFVIKMPSQYLPYAILLLTLILSSPQAMFIQATGLAAAHLYDLLTGLYPSSGVKQNLVLTPSFIKKISGTQTVVERPYGTATLPGVAREASWGLDLSWRRFGPGRTLGGEGSSPVPQRPTGLLLAAYAMVAFLLVCGFFGYSYVYGPPFGWLPGIDRQNASLASEKVS